ncbi:MAG: FAD-dependent oxidoreductase [Candidatus Nanopelagicaceae bacterium]
MPRALICGAGWAGLNCARVLQERGFAVQILEKNDRPGGRITTDFVEGFTIDNGFQVINPSYAELRETAILDGISSNKLAKGLEVVDGEQIFKVGDPRSNLSFLPDLLSGRFGSLPEKFAFLNYLRRPTEDIAFSEALLNSPKLVTNLLKPFLDGVVLTDVSSVSNKVVRELIHWFIKGAPVLVEGGVGRVSEALAAGLDIEFNIDVRSVSQKKVVTSNGEFDADFVVIATDPLSASNLLGISSPVMNYSATWYFDIAEGEIASKFLRVGGKGPVINSIALSNVAPSYAPTGRTLLAATTLKEVDELSVKNHLKQLWGVKTADWRFLTKRVIPFSLPFKAPKSELVADLKVNGIWCAGDWRTTPSQQGALLSGKLVANEISSFQ